MGSGGYERRTVTFSGADPDGPVHEVNFPSTPAMPTCAVIGGATVHLEVNGSGALYADDDAVVLWNIAGEWSIEK